ncbi:MAG TPA: chemotaxis protein CheX [bacterium]|nr:chemotaxis protein CheX [bacterium]
MNENITNDMICEAVSQVLADMAFIFTEPAPAHLPWNDDVLTAHLPFAGRQRGTLILSTTTSLCAEIAANLLGSDAAADYDPGHFCDSWGEIANVVGGVLMEKAYGTNLICHLGIPQVSPPREEAQIELPRTALYVSLLDDEWRRIDAAVILEPMAQAVGE